jgi:TAG lipase / steryl ester hydrolase / phospholipase A2 / LPA acyltransferase
MNQPLNLAPAVTDQPLDITPSTMVAPRVLRQRLREAPDYASWAEAAKALDRLSGREVWKQRDISALYDYATLRERVDHIREVRAKGDNHGLVFAIEEGVHGNLGGMGKPILYNKARFGTKQLIQDYVDSVADALRHIESLPESEMSAAAKLDLFRRASHCYGRSALMFSAGGTLMYFHFGVAKAMLEEGVLPSVMSGSSAGAITVAILGTHTDEELDGFFDSTNVRFGEEWTPNWFERSTGIRRMFGADSFEPTFERLIPDLTFREAFELSGRHISISVSPCERHHSPRLLNAMTSPHVLIRSAVRASCAIPGLFEPVQLMARDAQGKTVPYLRARWIDGLFAADLPAKQLARLYGTNHYIVSMINPMLLPTFRDHKLQSAGLQPLARMAKEAARSVLKSADVYIGKYLPASSLGAANKVAHDLLSQTYVGDISIAPRRRVFSPLRLLSPYTNEEIDEMVLSGERQVWPRMEMIRTCTNISRTLEEILARIDRGGIEAFF